MTNRKSWARDALISLLLFAVSFVLGYGACTLSAGSFQFWHVWGWFLN